VSPPSARPPWKNPDPTLVHELLDHLDPYLEDALDHGVPDLVSHSVGPDLWRVTLLDEDGCSRLLAVMEHRLDWQAGQHEPPNSMHTSGIVLEPLGLSPAMAVIRKEVIHPLAQVLFPEFDTLDSQYGFVATYGDGLDRDLGFHVDDSEVTLNLCLRHDSDGGQVVFQGRRCGAHRQTPHSPEEEVGVILAPGDALIHAGAHRHLVAPVSGERRNLIVWNRSSRWRARQTNVCPEWCGA